MRVPTVVMHVNIAKTAAVVVLGVITIKAIDAFTKCTPEERKAMANSLNKTAHDAIFYGSLRDLTRIIGL